MTQTLTSPVDDIDLVNDTICTVPQAAEHFGISKAKAWRLILKGDWPSVKIDASRRTSIEAIARTIQAENSK